MKIQTSFSKDLCFSIWLAIFLVAIVSVAKAQSKEWTWISGSNSDTVPTGKLGVPGVYGTLGLASAANVPGARQNAATWTDASGHLWLFGGDGLDSEGTLGELNDLWQFDPSTGVWTWMGGSNKVNASGVYGALGDESDDNVPGARDLTVAWTDSTRHLWLFGGLGYDATGVQAYLNDLWEYDLDSHVWTWISGSDGHDQVGVYGTLGEANANNVPGSREVAYSWIDSQDRLWLFGGFGENFDSVGGGCVSCHPVYLDDLWVFDPSTSEWTWMGGTNLGGTGGVYSVIGQPSASSFPGSRVNGQAWTDAQGRFWLFGGGVDYDAGNFSGYLNDLWFYDPSANEWGWMSGSGSLDQPGVYGTEGTGAEGNVPGSRYNTSGWVDTDGNLWLFGGPGYYQDPNSESISSNYLNDLWKFNPSNSEWTWIGGSDVASQAGVYGTQGVPAATNLPGARGGSASWTGTDGRFWLMGGYGDNSTNQVFMNDLWMYGPAESSPTATPVFRPAAGSYSEAQKVTISDSTAGATIYYTTDGNTPTTASTVYIGQITVSKSDAINAIATASGYSNSAVANAAYTISLPSVTLSPASLTFASQTQGTISAAQTVTLTDSGQAVLSITSIYVSGDFTETNTCGENIAAGAKCKISVAFSPTGTGTRTGILTIRDNANDSPHMVMLTGSGTAPAPFVTLSPISLTFPSQNTGTTSAANTVTLTNTGQSVLSIASIAASGDFAKTNTCGKSVAAGTNCAISVTFTPTALGIRTGILTVIDNASGSPHTISLTGSGTAPATSLQLSPTSLTFASQSIRTTSVAHTVTLTNSGQSVLSIASIAASGDFAETNTCGKSVAAGTNCAISVTFTPTSPGTRTGILTVIDNAGGLSPTVSLSGTGTVSALAVTLSPTSLTFAAGTDGSISAPQTITLTNSGTAVLSIASNTASANFAKTTTCASSVAVGNDCTISVTFTPTTGGDLTGTVAVTDNAPGSPQSVGLVGTGSTVMITSPSSGLTISTAGGSAAASLQLSPVGGFSGTVNLACSVSYQGTETPTDSPTCNLNPPLETVSNSTSTSATLTVNTTAAANSAVRTGSPWLRGGEGVLAAFVLFGTVPRKKRQRIGFLTVLGIIAIGGVFGCGGGLSGGTNPPSDPGTTPGSYSVTVTASSGTATASTKIPLSVQ